MAFVLSHPFATTPTTKTCRWGPRATRKDEAPRSCLFWISRLYFGGWKRVPFGKDTHKGDIFAGLAAAEASGWAVAAAGTVATVDAVTAIIVAVATIAAALGHGWDWRGQVGAAFGIDDEVALLPFADGGGFYAFEAFEGQVEHAAFA